MRAPRGAAEWGAVRSAPTLKSTNDRARSGLPVPASSTFFDGDDVHAFVRPAIQAGIVGKFRLMALRADGKTRRRNLHLLGPSLISTRT